MWAKMSDIGIGVAKDDDDNLPIKKYLTFSLGMVADISNRVYIRS